MSRELCALCPFCFRRELDSPNEVVVNLYLLDTFLSVYMDWLIDKDLLYEFSQDRRSQFRQVLILFSNLQESFRIGFLFLCESYLFCKVAEFFL